MDKHIIVGDQGKVIHDVNVVLPIRNVPESEIAKIFGKSKTIENQDEIGESDIDILDRMKESRLISVGMDPASSSSIREQTAEDLIEHMNSIYTQENTQFNDFGAKTPSICEDEPIDYLYDDEKKSQTCPGSNPNKTIQSFEIYDSFTSRMPREILDNANYDESGKFTKNLSEIFWPKVYDHSGLNSLAIPSRRSYIIPPEFENYVRGTQKISEEKLTAMYTLWREDLWDHLKAPPNWMKPEFFLLAASDEENGSIVYAQFLIARNNLYLKRALNKSGGTFKVRERLAQYNNIIKHASVIDNTSATFVRCMETLCKDQKACLEYLPQLIRSGAETLSSLTERITNKVETIENASKTKIDQLIKIFETKFGLDDSSSGKVMDSRINIQSQGTSSIIPSNQVALGSIGQVNPKITAKQSKQFYEIVAID